MDLAGRVALVTGAGRRIGQAIAIAFGARGAHLAIHYHASGAGARDTADRVRALGGRAELFAADLREPAAPAELMRRVATTFGRVDVLVNSAAMFRRTPIGQVSVAEWDEMMALNLRAPFFLCQAAAAAMTGGEGVIINIADLAAFEAWPGYVPHGITKAGVVQMTRALARALAPRIRVNAVAPGAVMLPEGTSAADARDLAASTPLGRIGSADDVANAAVFLAAADFVTGEILIVDGGRHLRR